MKGKPFLIWITHRQNIKGHLPRKTSEHPINVKRHCFVFGSFFLFLSIWGFNFLFSNFLRRGVKLSGEILELLHFHWEKPISLVIQLHQLYVSFNTDLGRLKTEQINAVRSPAAPCPAPLIFPSWETVTLQRLPAMRFHGWGLDGKPEVQCHQLYSQ